MSHIPRIINAEEKLLLIARPHWIYLLQGLLWTLLLFAAGLAADDYLALHLADSCHQVYVNLGFMQYTQSPFCFRWVLAAMGLAMLWVFIVTYLSVEIGLTDQRIIYKKGLFFIEVEQVGLEDVHGEEVFHGLFGWLLGYGKVRLECRYIGEIWLPALGKPYRLIKAMHIARLHHNGIPYDHHDLSRNMDRIGRDERNGRMLHLPRSRSKQAD